jgi:peptide/nickel transport system permease protein
MIRFIIRRILFSIPLLLGIATLVFFVIHIAPGDPMEMLMNQYQRNVPDPETIAAFRLKYGLDDPIHVQYIKWLQNCFTGDLGESFRYHRPVTSLIAERIPFTIQLTFLALLFDALFGIFLGIISAVKQYTLTDKIISVGSLIIYSVPGFWLALMLIIIFSVNLGWLPLSQTRSLDYELLSGAEQFKDRLLHLVLPVFVLGIASAASTARFLRSRLLEVLSEEFILAARARGLKEKAVIFRHALKNALIPIITIYGMSLPFLLGGSVLIENIFSWPGMGSLAVEAVQNRDHPLILATTMMGAILVVLGNLLADIMYTVVDPRVSYDS